MILGLIGKKIIAEQRYYSADLGSRKKIIIKTLVKQTQQDIEEMVLRMEITFDEVVYILVLGYINPSFPVFYIPAGNDEMRRNNSILPPCITMLKLMH